MRIIRFLSLSVCLFLIANAAFSQKQDRYGTKVSVRIIASPGVEVTKVPDATAIMGTFDASLFANDMVSFGLYLKYQMNEAEGKINNVTVKNKLYHMGFYFGTYLFRKPMFLDPMLVLQAGTGDLRTKANGSTTWRTDWGTFITPNLIFEKKLASVLRLGLGVNYRIAMGIDQRYTNGDAGGLGGLLYLKLSLF